jgi:hypothetical protein
MAAVAPEWTQGPVQEVPLLGPADATECFDAGAHGGAYLVTAGLDRVVRAWEMVTGECVLTFPRLPSGALGDALGRSHGCTKGREAHERGGMQRSGICGYVVRWRWLAVRTATWWRWRWRTVPCAHWAAATTMRLPTRGA